MSPETLMKEVQSVVLETDDLERQRKPNAYASFGPIS